MVLNSHFQDFITFYKHYPLLQAHSEEKDGMHCISRPNINSLESVSLRFLKRKKKKKKRKWAEGILGRRKKNLFLLQRSFPPQFRMFVFGTFKLWRKKIKYSPFSWRKCLGNDPYLTSLFHHFKAIFRCVFSQLTYLPSPSRLPPEYPSCPPWFRSQTSSPSPIQITGTGWSLFTRLSFWPELVVNPMRTKRFCC